MKTYNKNIQSNKFDELKKFWKSDLTSGFMVFILALPLSLGIARASGFPPAMGVLTGIVGGMVTFFFKVSPLTIKGPAAGLISISAAAVLEFGANEQSLNIVATVIVFMSLFQIITGFLKLGSLADFFPKSAVHGMLAAIGIIIILKQIPVLLGDEPSLYQGESPLELFIDIPKFINHSHWHIAFVGLISLIILFTLSKFNHKIVKKFPAPLVVLFITIPLSLYWHFKQTEPSYSLVEIGDLWKSINIKLDFSAIQTLAFWKYVIMFFFVSSLESLLTVKAIDNIDPNKNISNPNGDLVGQGFGNLISGFLGGLPMISEVVRSSANVYFNAKTKWSNFFHGFFLLLSMIFMVPLIELIPNAALAAMLIYAGYNLASPKNFIHAYQIGKEQLLIFVITILVTLLEDLLLGIAAGIIVKFIVELINGVPLKSFFKITFNIEKNNDCTILIIKDAAVFSNLLPLKKVINSLSENRKIVVDISNANYVDHSFMSYIRYLESESESDHFKVFGLDRLIPLSNHPESARKRKVLAV